MASLSTGAVLAMYNNNTSGQPVVQLLDVKRIQSPGGQQAQDRYRLVVSDGQHYMQAMLATQLNNLVETQQVECTPLVLLPVATSVPRSLPRGRRLPS